MKWGGAKDNSHQLSVEDADWVTSDKPALLTSDGCVRIYDTKLRTCQSVVSLKDLHGTVSLLKGSCSLCIIHIVTSNS